MKQNPYPEILRTIENKGAKLIAVSKYRKDEEIEAIYAQGQRNFAENRVQDLVDKKERLPHDIQWHMIGNLQTNKVKYLIDFIACIHSCAKEKLIAEIQKQAEKVNRTIPCLLEIHISNDDSKHGFSPESAVQFMTNSNYQKYPNCRFIGVMGMASLTDNQDQIRAEFKLLKELQMTIQSTTGISDFKEVSMGMSSDYKIALEEGATCVRIGSALFT